MYLDGAVGYPGDNVRLRSVLAGNVDFHRPDSRVVHVLSKLAARPLPDSPADSDSPARPST